MVPTEFATGLRVGQSVELRWTNCHRFYRANAVILAINAKTLRGRLTHDIPGENQVSYPEGTVIKVAMPYTRGFSQNNGVWPLTNPDSHHVGEAEKEAQARRMLNKMVGEAIDRGRAERDGLIVAQEPVRIV